MTTSAKAFNDRFKLIYENIKKFHLTGKPGGLEVANKYSNEIDKLISSELDLDYKSKGIVVVGLGGYGRRELCPKSDIDILILHEKSKSNEAKLLAENILYKLWDTGLEIGNSLRTIDDCLELASMQDSTILSSLLDERAIAGDSILHTRLKNELNKKLLPNISKNFINEKMLERKSRYEKYGSANFLLEPNIKEGQGCLRDIHSCFWILRAFHCQIEINRFLDAGLLNKEEIEIVNESLDFLLKIRNHLHLNKASDFDVIDYGFQSSAADFFKIKDDGFLTKENLFMKIFYRTTNKISQLTDKIIQRTVEKKIFTSRRIQNLDDFYIIHRGKIRAINPGSILDHPKNILKPFEYCANHSIEISDEVVNEVKKIKFHKFSIENKKALYSSFYDFLKKGKNVYVALKTLNNSELINFFIPEFEKIKDLAVADPSHIYTVDVHSLFVVNEFDKLLSGFYKEEFPLETKVANGLKRREVFYLASLLHDIGKGFGSNHAKRGAEMCKKICSRLTADKESYEFVEFLVREHLTMSSYSQKRDLDDPELISEFRERVQTMERLSYLFILTFCDLRSVGTDVWSPWKGNLLSTLYKKTIPLISKTKKGRLGKSKPSSKNEKTEQIFKEVNQVEFEKIAGKRHSNYFNNYEVEDIVYQINLLPRNAGPLSFGIRYSQKKQIDKLTIWSLDKEIGFQEICSALLSFNINVFSGRVTPLKNQLVLYTFEVNRFGHSTFREREVWGAIEASLNEKKLLVSSKTNQAKYIKSAGGKIKTKIKIDNSSSKRFTIIELVARDRPGILYDISKGLKDFDLDIGFVKIATKRGSVEDSFYVRKQDGGKLSDKNRIAAVKNGLLSIVA